MDIGEDIRRVYVTSRAAMQSLMQFLVEHPGMTYVLGDSYYDRLHLRWPLHVSRFAQTEDRCALIQELQKRPDYEGIIPATQAALDDVTELGMKKIAGGWVIQNMPPIPDGTYLTVYK